MGVILYSWARKSSWKCIWHSDKLNLTHHLLHTHTQIKKTSHEQSWAPATWPPPGSSSHLRFVLACVFSTLADSYEAKWQYTSSMTGSTLCTFEIETTLIWISITCSYYSPPISKSLPEDRTRPLQLRYRGSTAALRSWTTTAKKKKTDWLSPKCHVSLNESQRWLFLPPRWLLITPS